jgi:alpha-amylase
LGKGGFDTTSPLYKLVSQLNQIRNQAIFDNDEYLTYNNWAIYSDTSTIAMRKGEAGYQIITVLSNLGASGASYSLSLPATDTGFTANEALLEVLSCSQVTADGSGNVTVAMGKGLPKVCSMSSRS